jgi:tetratricopeptide (TPR) repeat protein
MAGSNDPAADLKEGMDAALEATRRDERNPYAQYAMAIISVYGSELAQAVRAAEKAVKLSPSFALGHLVLGMAKFFAGNAAEGAESLLRGLQLNRFDPQNFTWLGVLALAQLTTKQPAAALQSALQALQVRPTWRPAIEAVICCNVALGRIDEAREFARKLVSLPDLSDNALAPLRIRNPELAGEIAAMLRQAGWEGGQAK